MLTTAGDTRFSIGASVGTATAETCVGSGAVAEAACAFFACAPVKSLLACVHASKPQHRGKIVANFAARIVFSCSQDFSKGDNKLFTRMFRRDETADPSRSRPFS
jgi:hypothetical protein